MAPVSSKPMNKQQTTELLLQLETHSLVAAGKLIGNNGTFNQKQAWTNMLTKINILGSIKTVEQIKSHWSRLKTKAKDYNAVKKLYNRQTGNRTDINFQVDSELEWVLRIVGSSHQNGLNFGRELGFERTKMPDNQNSPEKSQNDLQSFRANPISNLQTEVLQKPKSLSDTSDTTAIGNSYGIVGTKLLASGQERIMALPQSTTLNVYADQGTPIKKPQSSCSGRIVIEKSNFVPSISLSMQNSNSFSGKLTTTSSCTAGMDHVRKENFQIERKILSNNVQRNVPTQENSFQQDRCLRDLIASASCSSAFETSVPLRPVNRNIEPVAPEKPAFQIINRKINFDFKKNAHELDNIHKNSASVNKKPSESTERTKSQNVPSRLKQQKTSKKLSRLFFSALDNNNQHQLTQPQPSHVPHTTTALSRRFSSAVDNNNQHQSTQPQSSHVPHTTTALGLSNNNLTPSMIKSLNYTRYAQSWSNQTNFQTMALAELSKNTQALNNLTKAISIYGGTLNHSEGKED